jgi:L-threonylcarbamoyladenylate synthase
VIIIDLENTHHQEAYSQALRTLKAGGLIIYPTETVYGLGADATNQKAVDKLLTFKTRREGKPLSIAVANQEMAEKYVKLNDQAHQLYRQFLPGPYTIISNYTAGLAAGVASEFKTLGVRISDYPFVSQLIQTFGKPITATSANASGKKRPYQISDILNNISNKQLSLIDVIINAGTLPPNQPSVVIDTTLSTPLIIRGKVDQVSDQTITLISNSDQETQQIAGKLLLKHWHQITQSGLVIALEGELGAGKTVFAKGIAQFLGIKQIISSPTYSYLKKYDYQRHQTRGTFYHLDLWKIDGQKQLDMLDIPQLMQPKNVLAVEWWSQVSNSIHIMPQLQVKLIVLDQSQRQLVISTSNQRP